MSIVKLNSRGRMTIPKEIRARLGLKTGDRLGVHIKDRHIVLTPKTLSIDDIVGILPKPQRPVSIEEMNEAIAAAASDMRD